MPEARASRLDKFDRNADVFRAWIGGECAAGVGTLQLPKTLDEVALGNVPEIILT